MNWVALVIEDNAVNASVISLMLEKNNYQVVVTGNGKEALNYLANPTNRVDIILLDYYMPIMNGLVFMQEYNQGSFPHRVPVIMVTGSHEQEDIEKSIKAGVYYYLNKPVQESILISLIEQAVLNNQKHNELRDIASQQYDVRLMLRSIQLEGKTFGEMRSMARFLSGFYPESQKAIIGIYELLINAVEHGNLGIDFAHKKQLLENMCWEQEVDKRQAITPYKDRVVTVHFVIEKTCITLTIADEGEGFDAQKMLGVVSRAPNETSGRGILIAREMSFDSLTYEGNGNTVVCTKKI
jgi:CheY-like chemotaxis protein/anti-sigma regulatory factor (Ser/Thr protein kinase)